MHIGNGIICPVTGIPMLLVAGTTAFFAFKNLKKEIKEGKINFSKDKIMLTVALTAFVFALQMINFLIPATGSSGHIIGAILLASLLGANTAFLLMCLILLTQAVFFADGGLLALGCNIFNMGFLACFVAYPLFFKPLKEKNKPVLGAILASIVALQLGSIAVVVEGALSGSIATSALLNFTGLMQLIHLPIGVVEGAFTGLILAVMKNSEIENKAKKVAFSFGIISIVLAGFISQFASTKPDGLEWSLLNISDFVTLQTQNALYKIAELFQLNTAILANIPTIFGNILGIFVVSILAYFVCNLLKGKEVKTNEQ